MARRPRQCIVATGYVRAGKLHVANRATLDAAIKQMADGGIVLRLEHHQNPRSVALNAYYWGVVIHHVSEETGYTDIETHEEMKRLHLPKRFAALRANGRIHGVRVFDGSTTDLNNDEEWEYLENIVRWAAEKLGVVIPDPQAEAIAS